MDWNDELLNRLATQIPCGYHAAGPASSEPTALAAIALGAAGRSTAKALDWIGSVQNSDGSVLPSASPTSPQAEPGWPTGWAVLAATAAGRMNPIRSGARAFDADRAIRWILQTAGDPATGTNENVQKSDRLGWPWINGTFSWVEPTAIHVVALKACGFANHSRVRDAIAMLVDRLLPHGGCNYGNTIVLGQELRPHVQPTGLAMLAIAGSANTDTRIGRSLDFLEANLSAATTSASMAYGLIGLAAHGRFPTGGRKWLEAAYNRTTARGGAPYQLALLSLASHAAECPLITLSRNGGSRE